MLSYLRQAVFGLFALTLLSLAYTVFFKGIFFDGLVYGSISRNLAEGNGTLFRLHYSETYGNHFIDNMPLFYWLEGIFFMIFGDHFWVEKLFCLALVLLSLYFLTILIKAADHRPTGGLKYTVVVLFLINPGILWVFSNNMVECLLIPLSLLFVYLFLCRIKHNHWSYYFISSLVLFALFLTKGPNGLFVLVIYPVWGALQGQFLKFSLEGVLILILAALWVYVLCILQPEFTNYLNDFYHKQIVESLYGNRESSGSHFTFIQVYINHFMFPILLCGLLLARRKIKGIKTVFTTNSILFFVTGLTMPLLFMLSTKQNAYYFSVSYAFFYISIGILFYDELAGISDWAYKQWKKLSFAVRESAPVFFLIFLIFINFHFFGTTIRDKDKIEEAARISKQQQSSIVVLQGAQENDWSLIGYLQRFHKKSAALPGQNRP